MASTIELLGRDVVTAIESRRDTLPPWPATSKYSGNGYVLTGFEVERTYLPITRLEHYLQNGKVWVVSSAQQELDSVSRNNVINETTGCIVAFQKLVNNVTDVDEIDDYVEFMAQLVETFRLEVRPRTFVGAEFMTDENGTPMSFVGLREASIFEAYMIVTWKSVHF